MLSEIQCLTLMWYDYYARHQHLFIFSFQFVIIHINAFFHVENWRKNNKRNWNIYTLCKNVIIIMIMRWFQCYYFRISAQNAIGRGKNTLIWVFICSACAKEKEISRRTETLNMLLKFPYSGKSLFEKREKNIFFPSKFQVYGAMLFSVCVLSSVKISHKR